MVVFEGYPETVLQELSRVVLYDTHLANTTCESLSPPSLYYYLTTITPFTLAVVIL